MSSRSRAPVVSPFTFTSARRRSRGGMREGSGKSRPAQILLLRFPSGSGSLIGSHASLAVIRGPPVPGRSCGAMFVNSSAHSVSQGCRSQLGLEESVFAALRSVPPRLGLVLAALQWTSARAGVRGVVRPVYELPERIKIGVTNRPAMRWEALRSGSYPSKDDPVQPRR